MSSLEGKVIAITGVASGIGQATALHLAKLGARLSIMDLADDALEKVTQEIQLITGDQNILSRAANICDRSAVELWMEDTIRKFGRLDGAVNTAGVHPRESGREPLWNVSDTDWKFAQDVNVQGTLNVLRAQLKYMVDAVSRKEIETGSLIVFGSNSSVTGTPHLSAYTTSKHAVIGLMRAAAMDAAPFNIRVNAVCPGPIDTPMLHKAVPSHAMHDIVTNIPLKRLGTPKEVVGLVQFLLSQDSGFCTGGVHMVDGGMTSK